MTGVLLQVRLDSSRFPRKALADLGGLTVFERCLRALRPVAADCHAVVTEPLSAPELAGLAQAEGWQVFVGPKDDVLERYLLACNHFGLTTVVRATGDNPLVSPRLANRLLQEHHLQGADYSGFLGAPVGSGVEVVQVSALRAASANSPDAYEREHVSPHLYRRPQTFRLYRPDVPPSCFYPDGRITLDTLEDWHYLCRLWADFLPQHLLETEELIPWLKSHPR
jgi:spore coat polysaccharide biosynthesis protein SpsF